MGDTRMIIAKMLKAEGRYSEAIKILEDKKGLYESLSLNDKLKYNYDIAWLYWKTNNELMYKYIEKNKELFIPKENRNNYKISYAKSLTLYTDIYKDKITKADYQKAFLKVYSLYNSISEYYSSLAMVKVLRSKGDKEKLNRYINYVLANSNDNILKDRIKQEKVV